MTPERAQGIAAFGDRDGRGVAPPVTVGRVIVHPSVHELPPRLLEPLVGNIWVPVWAVRPGSYGAVKPVAGEMPLWLLLHSRNGDYWQASYHTREQLGVTLDMSRTTVSRQLAQLRKHSLVFEVGRGTERKTRRHRPPFHPLIPSGVIHLLASPLHAQHLFPCLLSWAQFPFLYMCGTMSDPSDNPLRRFIGEIHRRSLWQVLGIYAVASWVVLQVAGELTDATALPEWFPTLALGLLIVGLPIVLATAFVQEGGPGHEAQPAEGTGQVAEARPKATVTSRLLTWKNATLGGIGAFAIVGVIAVGSMVTGGPIGIGAGTGSASIEQSVAVLPFVNMSGNVDNEYFSDGITEALLNALAQLPTLRVPARTSSFSFKNQNVPIGEIAEALNVAHILEGSVRRDGDRGESIPKLVETGAIPISGDGV